MTAATTRTRGAGPPGDLRGKGVSLRHQTKETAKVIEYPQGDQTGYEGYCIRPGKRSQDYRFRFFLPVYEAGGQHEKADGDGNPRQVPGSADNEPDQPDRGIRGTSGWICHGSTPAQAIVVDEIWKSVTVLIIRP